MGPDERDRRLGEAIDGFVEARRRGEPIEPAEWARRFPEIEQELRDCLGALPFLAGLPGPGGPTPAELPGYAILGEVGRGGMGVVYRALQVETQSTVALKFLNRELAASPVARRRFEREIELARTLDHPGIVRVLDSGEADGWLWCAMEFVAGEPLHTHLARTRPPVENILRLWVRIADALHHAHLRAVVHRDLKPGNVLVDCAGQPRILDFGLARFAEPDARGEPLTQSGQLVGTLPYLSPEQAGGSPGGVDIRSDLYALGVMLYEALAGRPPYDTSGPLFTALQSIQATVPPRVAQFRRVTPDLDAVVRKALEKAREDRYQTAAAFAEDLRCALRGEPVEANRTRAFFLLRKAWARHRRQVQVAALALLVLLASSAVILWLYVEVRRERDRLVLQRGLAHLAAGHDKLAENLIAPAFAARGDRAAHWSLVAWHLQNPQLAVLKNVGWVTALAWSADGRRLVAENLDGEVMAWDGDTFERLAATPGDRATLAARRAPPAPADAEAATTAVHPRGAGEATWSNGRVAYVDAAARRVVWEAAAGLAEPRPTSFWDCSPEHHHSWTPALAFSPDGAVLAASSWGAMVRPFDAATGRLLGDLRAHATAVYALASRPAGRVLAAGCVGEIRVWDLDRLPGVLEWRTDAGTERTAVALAPDGGTLAWAGGQGGTIHVLRPGQGSAPLCIDGHGAVVEALGFTADGLRLASADRDGTVVLRDAATGRPLRSWRTGRTFARGLAWAPDGERLAVGGFDGRIAILRADRDEPEREWQAHAGPVFTLAFAPDGSLASGGADWRARVWRPGAVRPSAEWRHGEWVAAVAFTPDGGLLATGSADLLIRLGSPDGAPRVPMRQSHGHWVTCLDFLDGGRVLVSGGNDEALRFWDCPSGEELASLSLHLGPVQSLAVARDGRKLLVGCPEVVRLLDLGAAFDRIASARQAAR